MSEEEKKVGWNNHRDGQGPGEAPELPPLKVLLTRNATVPWVYAALAAAPLTFVALLIYSMTHLPDQWGFHFAAWAKIGPLRIPALVCAFSSFLLAKFTYRIPFGNLDRKMLPEVLAYYPRTLKETGQTFLALLETAMALTLIYFGQLMIFVEIYRILSK